MIIQKATVDDIHGCVRISHIPEFSYLHKATDKIGKTYLLQFLRKGVFLVAKEKGEVIGFITGEPMLGNFMWIDAITVHKNHRGKGVGKRLFNSFKQVLRSKGVKHMYLMAPLFNKSTVSFYRSVGFNQGRNFVEFSQDI